MQHGINEVDVELKKDAKFFWVRWLSLACYVNIIVMWFHVIQVRWDEASSIPRPERASPWQIEPAVSPPPINPLPVHRPKRPRSNAVASLPDSSAPTKEGLTLSCVQNL